MMNAMYVLQNAKGTSRDEVMSKSEKIKPIALAIIKLYLPEGITQTGRRAGRQAGRQAFSETVKKSSFLKNFITIYLMSY